jgi:molecular chaperone DnaK (HSP70)
MKSRYIVGIDLGTTNSAVGYVDLHDASPGSIQILSFEIPQLVGHGRVSPRPALPSFLYVPGEYDLQSGALALPWDRDRTYAVGTFARDQGTLVPGRLVSSAKSWLCHGGVDREAPILPWGAGEEIEKLSPVTASSRYLQHIREAWDHSMPEPLADQAVTLTVPASFDEVARELTVKAAEAAGLPSVTLLEEPLAAFYAWLSHNEKDWGTHIETGDLLLVCDVGGGTTDFTLISCEEGGEGPRLERVAVGDHLLLGGDNMDLALAALAENALGGGLDAARWQALFHQCRQAKETLLGDNGPADVTVRLTGRGKSLIGGMMVTTLNREQAYRQLIEGFFPETEFAQADSSRPGSAALREMGLPYVDDPAVTRHLARFLDRQAAGRMPNAVLFNGGALKPVVIRERLVATLSAWSQSPVKTLHSSSLDLAISWGAAYYGLVREGLGLRVGGGTARAYFVGVGHGDGSGRSPQAVCLMERGTEEGNNVELLTPFRVRTNQPVKFSLYSSTTRKGDRTGDIVPADAEGLIRLPPLQTVLRYGKKERDVSLAVRLGGQITAIGTLELYCESQESPHRWRLQFQLREDNAAQNMDSQIEGVRVAPPAGEDRGGPKTLSEEDRKSLEGAAREIRRCFAFGDTDKPLSPDDLPRRLAECMGMEKELWPLAALRALADTLLDCKAGRKKSPQHEARWFNLAGFCLLPGFGEATDPWRIKKVWPLYFEGLVFPREGEPRLQWWIFWRRVAAGLSSGQQTQMFSSIAHVLSPGQPKTKKRKRSKSKAVKVSGAELREMWLLAANLERLEIARKTELGRSLVEMLGKLKTWPGGLWSLSRIGGRQPLYGPVNKVVPPGEVTSWLKALRKEEWEGKGRIVNAAVSMARLTGDRVRDLHPSARQDVITWLQVVGAGERQLDPLNRLVPFEARERSRVFGENLPEGLILEGGEVE